MNKLMNRAGLLAAAFALALAVALALNAATQTTEVAEAQTAIGTTHATDADIDGLIEISTRGDLEAMSANSDGIPCMQQSVATTCKGYELGGDISLEGSDWVPSRLNTVFNGNGFNITGLTGNDGLFSVIGADGVLKNVNVVNASITRVGTTDVRVGVLSAVNSGTIIGSYASGAVTVISNDTTEPRKDSIGGLVGRNDGKIFASVADVDVTVKRIPNGKPVRVGGFVGINKGLIHGSYAYGDVIDGRGIAFPVGTPGFRAYGFGINHTNSGGKIHWSFSYGNKVNTDLTKSPALFATGLTKGDRELVTNSCALKNRRTDFTYDEDDCRED